MRADYYNLKFESDKLNYLDQTGLPLQENYISTDSYERIAEAIERLEVRGAPLIGISAAYALALSLKNSSNPEKDFYTAFDRLASTRPTAVNLFYSLNRMKEKFELISGNSAVYESMLDEAVKLHKEEDEFSEKIAHNGLRIFKKKSNLLTHCNTGALAAGGMGTAFSIIKHAFDKNFVYHVFADETRPLLQGLRLTAFELEKNGIPYSVNTDSTAAVLMQQNKIDIVITGADRIALNGDSANKIGTYNLAVLCNYHNIPFYIAAPSTTIDRKIANGSEIEIEFRQGAELKEINGLKIVPDAYPTFTPAFDVTPAHLITGIITEEDLFLFPYNFLK
ncbi:MAG TPA: S-methyl-5-thioribose-1-phosphate isomerase [Ignavibacteriaceae bacterium]|nr:S-methyl-5-thioribose-1-phosphate isomerase [Ignavibacteriaceae bacterium]